MTEFLIAATAGIGVGILSSLFGVGGGILMVPFMVLVLERGQHLAEGTSLLVIIVTAIVGTIGHSKHGYVMFRWAALLGLGGIGGAFLGATIALGTSADVLRFLFGILVIYSGARLIRKARVDKTRTS